MPLWLERLSAPELAALSRDSTVLFFPVAALEDHGPHLPMGLDLDEAQTLCRLAAERLEAEKPGWTGLILPLAPLAVECNTSQWAFPVRGYVLRDYLVDVGGVFLKQGFRYLVAFAGNASPRQLTAIEEAGRLLNRRTRSSLGRLSSLFSSSKGAGPAALVSAQSGGTRPADLLRAPFGSDPLEHGGARDTSVALWLYQGSSREPGAPLPPAVDRPSGSALARGLARWRRQVSGYWGDPTKASVFNGESAVTETLNETFPKLRAWFDGANPNALFRSWHSVLPSNRTTFRAWMLLLAIAILFSAYIYIGTQGLGE